MSDRPFLFLGFPSGFLGKADNPYGVDNDEIAK